MTDDDIIVSDEMCQLFYQFGPGINQISNCNFMAQMLRRLPFETFKHMIDKFGFTWNHIYAMGKYQKSDTDHWDRVMEKINYFETIYQGGALCSYYHNKLLDYVSCDMPLLWFNTSNITHEYLLNITTPAVLCCFRMAANYLRIPNAETRAAETLNLLQICVHENPILMGHILIIKLITNKLTLDDVPFFDDNMDIILLLIHKQYDLIQAYDVQMKGPYLLKYYIFNRYEELECVCKCKNIILRDCDYSRILTIPLIEKINQGKISIDPAAAADIMSQFKDWINSNALKVINFTDTSTVVSQK